MAVSHGQPHIRRRHPCFAALSLVLTKRLCFKNMGSLSRPYPSHIEVPVRYTPTAELDHSQLMRLLELSMPAIEDLSWEDVVTNSYMKLRDYSKAYGARAEGIRMPRYRAEMEIFFTALLHARYSTTRSASEQVQLKNHEPLFKNRSTIHVDVRELALENGLAFHLSQRFGINFIATVLKFASEKGGKWTDESSALSAALVMEEIASAAERKANRVKGGAGEGGTDMSELMECLKRCGPWDGWCGFRSGFHLKWE